MTDEPAEGMGGLLAIAEHEMANLGLSVETLGAAFVELVDECFGLYYCLANRDADCASPERQDTSVTHFIVACGSNLYAAALCVMRAHAFDSAFYTRRAVESAAFILAMREDPESFNTWLNARDGDEQAKIYKNRFRAIVVLPRASPHPHRKLLREVFEVCSELAHPTIGSFKGRVHPTGPTGAVFRFFETATADEAAEALLWTLHVHEAILRVLAESYEQVLKLNTTDWPARFDQWVGRREALRQRQAGRDAAERVPGAISAYNAPVASTVRGRLVNSPLIEVVLELKFPGSFEVREGMASLQRSMSADYPRLFVPQSSPGAFPDLTPHRLSSSDDSTSVNIALNLFSVQVRRYGVFGEFRALFEDLWSRFLKIHSPKHFTRLGLRYVNLLPSETNSRPDAPHQWLRLGLTAPPSLNRRMKEFASMSVLEFGEGLLRLTIGSVSIEKKGPPGASSKQDDGYTLDMDFFREGEIPVGDLLGFVDRAHETIESLFFDLITPAGLAAMEGGQQR